MNLGLGVNFAAVRHMKGRGLDFWRADSVEEAKTKAEELSSGNSRYWYVTEVDSCFKVFSANTDPSNAVTSYRNGQEELLEREKLKLSAFA